MRICATIRPTAATGIFGQDPAAQLYQATKDHFRTVEPGVTVGGPIMKDRLWFFAGFEPLVNTRARTVDFSPVDPGMQAIKYFTQDRQTYFAHAAVSITRSHQKIRRLWFVAVPIRARNRRQPADLRSDPNSRLT